MSDQHSVLPPSSAARRVACPGSRKLEAEIPNEESEKSKEGQAAHWVAAEYLNAHLENCEPEVSRWPFDTEITEEMIKGAALYKDEICKVLSQATLACRPVIEERLAIPNIHPDCWGTPDAYCFTLDGIYIWDYKYGHVNVEAFENWQLIEYAAGVIDKYGLQQATELRVVMTIIQPRVFNSASIKKWSITIGELRAYFNILRAAETAAMEPTALCIPSPECHYCRARSVCPALGETALTVAAIAKENQAQITTPEVLANELRYLENAAELLNSRITGLTQTAIHYISTGKRVPGYRLEASSGREVWKADTAKFVEMVNYLGLDIKKPQELITPRQAREKGVPDELVFAFSHRASGKTTLAQEDLKQLDKIFNQKQE